MMRKLLCGRSMSVVLAGAMLLQVGGCTFAQFNDLLQTIFLGITAAGSIAILRNI